MNIVISEKQKDAIDKIVANIIEVNGERFNRAETLFYYLENAEFDAK